MSKAVLLVKPPGKEKWGTPQHIEWTQGHPGTQRTVELTLGNINVTLGHGLEHEELTVNATDGRYVRLQPDGGVHDLFEHTDADGTTYRIFHSRIHKQHRRPR